jgi:hypothetical protein
MQENSFIKSFKTRFFDTGLSRGTYGLELTLANCKSLESPEFLAMKKILETELPPANKIARIRLAENFNSNDALRWLLSAFNRYDFSTQVIFTPSSGSLESLNLASWRILEVRDPEATFIDFNELWFRATEKTIALEFPLWQLKHAIFLYIDAQGLPMESTLKFMSSSLYAWSLL